MDQAAHFPFPADAALRSAFAAAFAAAETWNAEGRLFFPHPGASDTADADFATLTLGLQYHNQQVWHYEDCGRSDDESSIVAGWRGAMEHNKFRNQCINRIDALLGHRQSAHAPLHSESLGSLTDRITILQLKQVAYRAHDAEVAAAVRSQRDELVDYAIRLAGRLWRGEVRVQAVPRLKLYLPRMLASTARAR